MGSEATIRYLKARLAVMEEELFETTSLAREREEALGELTQRNKELEEDKTKSAKSAESLKVKLDKVKADLQAKTKLNDSLEQQLRASVKEREHLERSYKQSDSAAGVKDVRLNRALEDVERYKKLLQEAKTTHLELSEQGRKQLDNAVAEKKRLLKQKSELITAFKNQMKLIDVLKRQVIHLQAAKLLDISEKDFSRALELGEQI
jgi:chromosome segregation ATPase